MNIKSLLRTADAFYKFAQSQDELLNALKPELRNYMKNAQKKWSVGVADLVRDMKIDFIVRQHYYCQFTIAKKSAPLLTKEETTSKVVMSGILFYKKGSSGALQEYQPTEEELQYVEAYRQKLVKWGNTPDAFNVWNEFSPAFIKRLSDAVVATPVTVNNPEEAANTADASFSIDLPL